MIDSIAMILCIGGQAALAFGFRRTGFAAALAGSGCWLLFAMGVNSNTLLLQSVAFLVFSGVGLVGKDR
jgi:hypothetical protein